VAAGVVLIALFRGLLGPAGATTGRILSAADAEARELELAG
jgi:hypothetical protein